MPKVKESLERLQASPLIDTEGNLFEYQGASISVLRNRGVNKGASERCSQTNFPFDYYMCIDSDIEFQVEDVLKLIERDKDIISGAYQDRGDPDGTVAGKYSGVPGVISREDFIPWRETGLHEVDWVGAGFLLIKADVLRKMKFPYFREEIIEYERAGILHAAWVGEDVGFCMAAKKAGFQIWCDMDVKVNHLTYPWFSSDSEDEFSQLQGKKFSPAEAHKFFVEKLEKTVQILHLLKGCGDMFYDGLQQYQARIDNMTSSNFLSELPYTSNHKNNEGE